MRPALTFSVVIVLFLACATAVSAEERLLRETHWVEIELAPGAPPALVDPEGSTDWDLSTLPLGRRWVRRLEMGERGTARIRRTDGDPGESGAPRAVTVFEDGAGSDGAERWLLPERETTLASDVPARPILVTERRGDASREIRIDSQRVGRGSLRLPSGVHDAVLQRALVLSRSGKGGEFRPELLVHRWIEPGRGLLAEVRGPASADGLNRTAITGAAVVESRSGEKAGLRVYANDVDRPIDTRLAFGYDRGTGVAVSALTVTPHTTIGDLVNAASWDFSPNTSANAAAESASTTTAVNSAETCSWDKCGFTIPGVKLGREDRNYDDPPNAEITTTVLEREDRAGDVTLWLRAGVNDEGIVGASLFEGEARLCYVEDGRTPVPLWQFQHEDTTAGDFYLQNGDSWTHTPFACENTIFKHVCPDACGALVCPNFIKPCTGFSGTLSSAVINEGFVTLPSGHEFEALLVRSVAEFCVYPFSGCGFQADSVRTVTHLWEVPNLGTVVRLQSAQVAPDYTSYTTLDLTDIKFGLFPPLSVTATPLSDTSMSVSWNPGSVTSHIDRYRVYYDTDTGADSTYWLDTTVTGSTSTTISGLAPGTRYYFTVTAISDYTNPANPLMRTYESALYPTQIPANPTPLPVEVTGDTTGSCTPPDEDQVTGLLVDQLRDDSDVPTGDIHLHWDEATDPCHKGYRIRASSVRGPRDAYPDLVPNTGLNTSRTLENPTDVYYYIDFRD